MKKKALLIFCELYMGFVSISLLFLMLYLLIFPMFINPNLYGMVTIYTNRYNELYFDWYLTVVCLIIALFCLFYIIYYRFKLGD